MVNRWLCTVAATAALALASGARGQTTQDAVAEEIATKTPVEEPKPEDPNTGAFTLTGGVDWTTAYFFRGYNQEDTGLILQPYATLTTNIYDGDSFDINLYGGTWNSFHSEQTLASSGPSSWYESDAFFGADFVIDKFTIGAIYTFYMYPNGAFETIQELGFKVSYDDLDLMKKAGVDFGLKPYFGIYIETDDGNGTEDTYAEVGIAPSLALGSTGVTISVPIALGLSIDDYYLDSSGDNEVFGYGSISLLGSIPIPMPAKYGAWTLTAGVQYIQLFADSAEAANDGGTEYEVLGKVGVSFAY